MAHLRLFAAARDAAGRSSDEVPGASVEEVLDAATARYGDDFARLLPSCRIWLNGDAADANTTVTDDDEVAVLPPVSGG
jgi:molybdopterin synthase sulfur carrier subunit